MKTRHLLVALLSALLSAGAHAAGSPMNEDFSNLIALSKDALDAGQSGDQQAFLAKTNIAMDAYKEQASNEMGYSIRLPRTAPKLRAALKAAKAGNLQDGMASLEQAIDIMQKD